MIDQLSQFGLNPILEGVSDKNLSGIVSFKHDNASEIVEYLKDNKIICSVREGMVRISPHFYNNEEDFELLIGTLLKFKK